MKNKLFIPLILCVLAACDSKSIYSGKVETQQDLADCLKAGMHAWRYYREKLGFPLSRESEDVWLGAGDDFYLYFAEKNISYMMDEPAESARVARTKLDNYANGAWVPDVWEATCRLAYLTGEEVDWPKY